MQQFLSGTDKKVVKMQNGKRYEKAQITVTHFDGEDVIRTSLLDGDNVGTFKANWIGFIGGMEQ